MHAPLILCGTVTNTMANSHVARKEMPNDQDKSVATVAE